jgi:hypothetical protein
MEAAAPSTAAKPDLRYLIDSYLVWAAGEGVPIVEGVAIDLDRVETAPWARVGKDCRGAFVHLRGRGDFLAAAATGCATSMTN